MRIVLPPTNPDLDGVACAVAYAELLTRVGVSALPWYCGALDAETSYVITRSDAPVFANNDEMLQGTDAVYVDASDTKLLPHEIESRLVVEVIDHHFPHRAAADFPNATIDVQPVGAAATLVVERFRARALVPSQMSSVLLYCAIFSNTQDLKGSITTPRDLDATQWLVGSSNIPDGIVAGQFAARRSDILRDLASAIGRESKVYEDALGAFTLAQLEFPGAEAVMSECSPLLFENTRVLGVRAALNMVDVSGGRSFLLVPNGEFRGQLSRACGLLFDGAIAAAQPIMLRKQIVAALSGYRWPTT